MEKQTPESKKEGGKKRSGEGRKKKGRGGKEWGWKEGNRGQWYLLDHIKGAGIALQAL